MQDLFYNLPLPSNPENYRHYERYRKFILSRPKRNLEKNGSLYHIHHVCPSAFGLFDVKDRNNLIKLTLREHFIAHMILFYCRYPSMISAFYRMVTDINNYESKLTSKQYQTLMIELREKISKDQKGKEKPKGFGEKISKALKGKPKSKEHIENNRLSQIGVKRSKETKDNCRKAQLGRKHSQEVKDKISIANIGKSRGVRGKNNNARKVLCLETGEIFYCLKDASDKIYGSVKFYYRISRSLKDHKQKNGFTWVYYT